MYFLQTHSGLIQTIQQTADVNGSPFRSNYHPVQDYYNGQNINSTGAVPRTAWMSPVDSNKPPPRPLPHNDEFPHNSHLAQSVAVHIESKDVSQKDQKNKTMAKTYNTIKDMISSRFKNNKDSEDKVEETGLNNVAEELRKSQANIADDLGNKKSSDQGKITNSTFYILSIYHFSFYLGYTKQPAIPPQYAQSFMQQQMLAQHAQQQYQQQLKNQQYSQQIAQARSQEMLNQHPEEQLYYQSYAASPQRRHPQGSNREGNYVQMHQNLQVIFLIMNIVLNLI